MGSSYFVRCVRQGVNGFCIDTNDDGVLDTFLGLNGEFSAIAGRSSPYDFTNIETLADLKLYDGQAIIVFVMGRTATKDGYEDIFIWDSTDLSTEVAADTLEGIYVAPTSDPTGASGAWVRSCFYLDPVWFNPACGDGISDCSPTFTAMVALLPITGQTSRHIKVTKPGIYKFNSEVSINIPGVLIEGIAGPGRNAGSIYGTFFSPGANIAGDIFKFTTDADAAAVHSCAMKNIAFRDENNRNYTVNSCIHLHNANSFKAENLWFYNIAGSAIKFTDAVDPQMNNITVDSCGSSGHPSIDGDYSGAGASIQSLSMDGVRVEVSYDSENIYVGAIARACKFNNVTLENSNNASTDNTLLHDAGYKNNWSNVSLNAHHGDDERMEAAGTFNNYNNFTFGSLSNGNPSSLVLLDAAAHCNFSNFTIRETNAADGARYFFKLSNSAVKNQFSNININMYGGFDIDSGCNINTINGLSFENSRAKIININSNGNRVTDINGELDALTSGDLATVAGDRNVISGTFSSLNGVDNVVNFTGDRNHLFGSSFYDITNKPVADSGSYNRIDQSNEGLEETITTDAQTLNHWGVTHIDTTAGALAGTLPNGGYNGQIKTIRMTVDGGDYTLTITRHDTSVPEVLTFDDVGDKACLIWNDNNWATISLKGITP